MAIDRRVARTRTALYDGLIALVLRKSYDDVSIEEILHEANVGRSTFYAHFTSKDDLLSRSLERLRAELIAAQEAQEGALHLEYSWGPSRVLFEHVARHVEVRRQLRGTRGGMIVTAAIDRILADLLRSFLPPKIEGMPPRDLAILHIVATINTTLDWWLDHADGVTPAEAEDLFRRLAFSGVPEELVARCCQTNSHYSKFGRSSVVEARVQPMSACHSA